MPAGSWRDILNAMRAIPEWKISLDIEPASWDDLRREDPQAYRELRKLLDDRTVNARVEVVNGTFSQPFGWAQGGESNIRQLLRGREVIKQHFPNAVVETYAVQEPCWASCLPQLLRSLGFTAAVLKDPGTAWGGYASGFDAETVDWVGPDGTSIAAVPRYACEELLRAGKPNPSPARRSSAANAPPTASPTRRGTAFRIWVGRRGQKSRAHTYASSPGGSTCGRWPTNRKNSGASARKIS